MAVKKIILFISEPLSDRDYKRFGIETLRQNSFEIEVWDCTSFLWPKAFGKTKVKHANIHRECKIFSDRDSAIKAISQLKNTESLALCTFRYSFDTFIIYRALSKNYVKYCMLVTNSLPMPSHGCKPRSLFDKIKRTGSIRSFSMVSELLYRKIFDELFPKINYYYLGIQPADFVLADGKRSIDYALLLGKDTEIIWGHAMDYDIYLKIKECGEPIQDEKNTGIFLDENVALHPDYLYCGVEPFSTPEQYFPVLCRFFDYLENNFKTHISIAAHPTFDHGRHPDFFGARSVVQGKTAELVRNAKFVIAHSSTSINFSVLFKKPIVFVTTDSLERSHQGPFIALMASMFGKVPINLSRPIHIDWEKEMTVDMAAYERYKNNYIKKNGSEELPLWQIFANSIRAME